MTFLPQIICDENLPVCQKFYTEKFVDLEELGGGWVGWATILCHTQPVADACKMKKRKLDFVFCQTKL